MLDKILSKLEDEELMKMDFVKEINGIKRRVSAYKVGYMIRIDIRTTE
jgi:hypothetical protein